MENKPWKTRFHRKPCWQGTFLLFAPRHCWRYINPNFFFSVKPQNFSFPPLIHSAGSGRKLFYFEIHLNFYFIYSPTSYPPPPLPPNWAQQWKSQIYAEKKGTKKKIRRWKTIIEFESECFSLSYFASINSSIFMVVHLCEKQSREGSYRKDEKRRERRWVGKSKWM